MTLFAVHPWSSRRAKTPSPRTVLPRLLLAVCLLAAAWPARAAWDVRQIDNRDYVTLQSFCEFYGFAYKDPGSAEYFKTTNGQDEMVLRMDSRIIYLDGYRHWLSFDIMRDPDRDRYPDHNGPWLISKTDVVRLFEPLLRPHMIKGRHPIRGVVLDAGHGGNDAGAGKGNTLREKQLTLDMVGRMKALLEAKGINVALTRRSDVFVDLTERAERAAHYEDYIFVSCHFNSASSDAYGVETYACSPQGTSSSNGGAKVSRSDYQLQVNNGQDPFNILLAHEIQTRLAALYPGNDAADRGVKRARFVVLRKNALPSVLIEFGFLSNPRELRTIAKESHRDKLAKAAVDGILSFMAQMAPPSTRLSSPTLRGPVINTNAPEVSAPPTREVPHLDKPPTPETDIDRKLQSEPARTNVPGHESEIIIYGQ